MNKNLIIVTGGCGYIGAQTIIEILRNTDYDVLSIDNCINSSKKALERIKAITGKEVENYRIDLRSLEPIRNLFSTYLDQVVGVIHFAALKSVPDSVADPLFYYDNNINSLINILKCCEEFGIENFIFSSSCSVYGNVKSLPVNESTPLSEAESPYAHTKQVGEEIIRSFSKKTRLNCIALRYFNPVGADASGLIGEDPINRPNNLVPVITQTAAGIIPKLTVFGGDYDTRDGSCVRDYVHVSDIANAHIKSLNYLIEAKNSRNFEIFNLGTGQGITVLEAIEAFEKISKKKLNYEVGPRRDGDVASIYSDCTRSLQRLDWEAKFGIDEMMETAWKWQLTLSGEKV